MHMQCILLRNVLLKTAINVVRDIYYFAVALKLQEKLLKFLFMENCENAVLV